MEVLLNIPSSPGLKGLCKAFLLFSGECILPCYLVQSQVTDDVLQGEPGMAHGVVFWSSAVKCLYMHLMKMCLPVLDKWKVSFGQPWDFSVLLTSDSIRAPNLGWIMFICWLAGCFLLLCLLLVLKRKLEVVLLGFLWLSLHSQPCYS